MGKASYMEMQERFPRFTDTLEDIEEIAKAGYDPNQPRNDHGEWTDTGASSRPERGETVKISSEDSKTIRQAAQQTTRKRGVKLEPNLRLDGNGDIELNELLLVGDTDSYDRRDWGWFRREGITLTVDGDAKMDIAVLGLGYGGELETHIQAYWRGGKFVGVGEQGRVLRGDPEVIGQLRKRGFDPNQPRDEIGRWTDIGFGVTDARTQVEFNELASKTNLSGEEERALEDRLIGPHSDQERTARLLRTGSMSNAPPFFAEDVRLIDEAIARHRLDEDITVWKGINVGETGWGGKPGALTRDQFKQLVGDRGTVIRDPAFMATSMSREWASNFGNEMFQIKIPAGKAAMAVPTYLNQGSAGAELEVLLPRGTSIQFRGKDALDRSNVWRFEVE